MRLVVPVRPLLAGVVVLAGTIGGCKAFVANPFLSISNGEKSAHRLHKSESLSCGIGSPALTPASRLRCCGGKVRRRTYLLDMASSSAPSQWVRSAKRRSSTALILNSSGSGGGGVGGGAGGGGEGPGTQQLSRQAKLVISVLIDLIGMSSFALPGIGEATDLGWAPISSALILYLYGNSIFAGLAFVEEILPGFDIIPTATIAWFLTNSEVGQNVTNAASGKAGGPTNNTASSAPPPPPPPPASRAGASPAKRGSRKVDGNLVQSGVIDVDSVD